MSIYLPPCANIVFLDEMTAFLSKCDDSCLILAGDIYIDVMNYNKYGIRDYLGLLATCRLEDQIRNYTREEYQEEKLLNHA